MRAMIRKFASMGGDEGAALVETAFASIIFLAMLIGTFQLLLASYTFHYVSDAAREATRYAIVRGSTSCTNTPSLSNCNATSDEIQAYVRRLKYPGITPGKLTVTTTYLCACATRPTTWSSCTSNAPGNQVKSVATYQFPFSVPFVPRSTLSLTSTSSMVISQ